MSQVIARARIGVTFLWLSLPKTLTAKMLTGVGVKQERVNEWRVFGLCDPIWLTEVAFLLTK